MAGRRPRKKKGNASVFFLIALLFAGFLAYLFWNSGQIDALHFSQPTVSTSTVSTKAVGEAVKSREKQEADTVSKEEPSQKVVKETKKIVPTKSTKKAKMAIVIDDFGNSLSIAKTYSNMGIPFTFAIFPNKPYTAEIAQIGHAAGMDIIVHLPMESISNDAPEAITIRTNMSEEEIRSLAAKAFDSVPYAIGFNNHQGSKATASKYVVSIVSKEGAKRGFFFLDSRTSAASIVPSVARSYGLLSGENEFFIDNRDTVEAIEEALQEAATRALQSNKKSIIVIGHAKPNTAKAVGAMINTLQAQGIEFVLVKNLLY